MPVARTIAVAIVGLALLACHEQQPQQDQNVVITNDIPGNADIETLPPDESTGTTDNEVGNDLNSY